MTSSINLYVIVFLGQLIFAATPLFAKVALREFDPFTLGLLRFVLCMIILNSVLLVRKRKIIPDRKDWLKILFLGFLAIPINQGFFLYGLKFTTPGHSTLLYCLTPAVVYLVAIPLLKEKPSWRRLGGILVAFSGVVLILSDKSITLAPDFILGDLLIFAAVVAWALYTAWGKQLVHKLGAFYAITYTMTFGTILFLPLGSYNALTFDYSHVSLLAWISLLFIAVITSSISYPLWFWALKRMEASKLAAFIFVQPVITSTLSHLFLSEQLTRHFLLGGATVILGVFIAEKS